MTTPIRLTIAGLGPGRADLIPDAAIAAAKKASKVLVRTGNHPAVPILQKQGIRFETFDALYEEANDFDRLYPLIAEKVLESARTQETLYLVPGNPLLAERTVEIILASQEGKAATVIPATGFAEAVLMALSRPAPSGYSLVDAYDIHRGNLAAGPSAVSPTILFQTHDYFMMSEAKLWLLEYLPADFGVFIVDAAGSGEGERVVPVPVEDLDRAGIAGPLTSVFVPAAPVPAGEQSGAD